MSSQQNKENCEPLSVLLSRFRNQLKQMIALRIDPRMRGRVDASDVIQDAFLEASQRYDEYLRDPTVSPYIWLRFLVAQKLAFVHRHHLGVQARDARKEVSIFQGGLPGASSQTLAALMIKSYTTASEAFDRAENQLQLQQALNDLDELDREVLILRHFEQLTNVEVAEVLQIETSAASKRYLRALRRLGLALDTLPGSNEEE